MASSRQIGIRACRIMRLVRISDQAYEIIHHAVFVQTLGTIEKKILAGGPVKTTIVVRAPEIAEIVHAAGLFALGMK